MRATLFALLLAAQARGAGDDNLLALADAVREGAWTERIRAVNQLGSMGAQGAAALRPALQDPDWQVRFAAVYWLGRGGGRGALEDLLASESCPPVRMSLHHWLARPGREPSPPEEAGRASACESWFWPVSRDTLSLKRRSSRMVVATPPDARGCVYARYRKVGRSSCPTGMLLKGVGPAPGRAELLEDEAPDSGVALCCPAGKTPLDSPPTAEQAECRLVPEECPPGWAELAPDDLSAEERRKLGYQRTKQQKEGDMAWLNCCRKSAPPEPEKEPDLPAPEPRWVEPDREERIAGLPFGLTFPLSKASGRPAPAPKPSPRDGSRTLAAAVPVESLMETLEDGDVKARERSALALARLGPEASRAVEALASALREDESPRVRACAALALAGITRGTDRAVRLLEKALSDSHPGVRDSAAQALGAVGTPAAQKAFLRAARAEALGVIEKGG